MYYDPIKRIWYYYVHQGAWDDNPDVVRLAPISYGRDYAQGERYPDHWIYDPWTGKNFQAGMTRDQELFQILFQQGEKE